tara:strand:+ start:1325 stop:1594 length:270 start_codon:yes stop_codon:yes gene_type:complete
MRVGDINHYYFRFMQLGREEGEKFISAVRERLSDLEGSAELWKVFGELGYHVTKAIGIIRADPEEDEQGDEDLREDEEEDDENDLFLLG